MILSSQWSTLHSQSQNYYPSKRRQHPEFLLSLWFQLLTPWYQHPQLPSFATKKKRISSISNRSKVCHLPPIGSQTLSLTYWKQCSFHWWHCYYSKFSTWISQTSGWLCYCTLLHWYHSLMQLHSFSLRNLQLRMSLYLCIYSSQA